MVEQSKSQTSMKTTASQESQMFVDSTKANIKEQYHFVKKLAQGGFGIVYLAEHRQTKEMFAVKAIQKKKVKDYTTFINEINILRLLDHPNIIKLHEIFEWNEVCFLVLEYCSGGELFHYILERKHLSEREAANIMRQLLSALVYLHSQNISHRDIKPENFMLARDKDPSCVKMIDFGLSKDFSGGSMSTMSGSPYYIAPEVFLQNYNSKIDIWSMGVVLYIMLSGKVPFPGNSELEIIGNVIKGEFHFEHAPFTLHSKEAKDFLQCLIVKDVHQRYTAVQAFNHPWIQNQSVHNTESIPQEAINIDMRQTINVLKVKKIVLLQLSQTASAPILSQLKKNLESLDPEQTQFVSTALFKEVTEKAQLYLGDRLFKELCEELDPKKNDRIPYQVFLDTLYLTQMYLKEFALYETLKQADKDGKGGVTISQMQEILAREGDLKMPEDALGATFRQMLGADINTIDPACIIDTEKFIASLHKEFESIMQRTLSQIEDK